MVADEGQPQVEVEGSTFELLRAGTSLVK